MSKKRNIDHEKVCLFCENAAILKSNNNVLCKYNGIVNEGYVCRKFVYDPLKRKPNSPLKVQALSEDDLI